MGNYGEAGAIERYGPAPRLPQSYSGADNFWLWGPPPASELDEQGAQIDLAATITASLATDQPWRPAT